MSRLQRNKLVADHEGYLHRSFLVAIELGRPDGPGPAFHLLVHALSQDLLEHMAAEEVQLFPWLLETLPDCLPLVEGLAREHVELTRLLSLLEQEQLSAEPVGSRPGIDLVKKFVRLLDQHTALESELLSAADAG